MKAVKHLQKVLKTLALVPDTLVYVQSGFNRFEINSYVVQKDGSLLIILNEEASNPVAERVVSPKD